MMLRRCPCGKIYHWPARAAPAMVHMPEAQDSWAEVELYRLQYGELPPLDGERCKPLVPAEGLRVLAKIIESGENVPPPFSVAAVLKYVAAALDRPPQD